MGFNHNFPEVKGDEHGIESPGYCALSDDGRRLVMLCCEGLSNCQLQGQLAKSQGEDIGKVSLEVQLNLLKMNSDTNAKH